VHFRAFAGGFEEAYSKDSSGKAPLGLEVSMAREETPRHRTASPFKPEAIKMHKPKQSGKTWNHR
jgi:hypothetical protein